MENDTFYIHRIIHDTAFYNEEVFLCESMNLKNECDTVYVNGDSGTIFDRLKLKFKNEESNVLFFPLPLCAAGHTIRETDFIPGPSFTKRAVNVEIVVDNEPGDSN